MRRRWFHPHRTCTRNSPLTSSPALELERMEASYFEVPQSEHALDGWCGAMLVA
ncbi:hypothetical protein [Burkholderia arboris]|uniref:hypothetical protein n=1 Tax=Burkholderia arboris TaxID=488730 RepID=UPI00158D7CED|nr:hypothetical protein [Burkholderia arboris]